MIGVRNRSIIDYDLIENIMSGTNTKSSNSFLSGFFHIGLGTMINMIIGFFTTPIITRIVAPSEYGRLSIFTMYINISIMVLCFGLDQALIRYYYKKNYRREI